MEKPLYKPLYVIAGKREDGTYGIFRNRPTDIVDCFDNPDEAERHRTEKYRYSCFETIVLDIGFIVDPNIPREGNSLDASGKMNRD